jgi:hypothetical protein
LSVAAADRNRNLKLNAVKNKAGMTAKIKLCCRKNRRKGIPQMLSKILETFSRQLFKRHYKGFRQDSGKSSELNCICIGFVLQLVYSISASGYGAAAAYSECKWHAEEGRKNTNLSGQP